MKKNLRKLVIPLALCLALVSLNACSSDDDNVATEDTYTPETFFETFITNDAFGSEDSYTSTNYIYEFGLTFTPIVKGKITHLNVKIPVANSALRITIWDVTTKTVLRTETVNIATGATATEFDIADLELTKDTPYCISMNTGSYYYYSLDKAVTSFPLTIGNIQIDGIIYRRTTAQIYPDQYTNASNYYGNLSFTFLQN